MTQQLLLETREAKEEAEWRAKIARAERQAAEAERQAAAAKLQEMLAQESERAVARSEKSIERSLQSHTSHKELFTQLGAVQASRGSVCILAA